MKKSDLFTRSIVLTLVVLFFTLSCGENKSDQELAVKNNIAKINAIVKTMISLCSRIYCLIYFLPFIL